MASGKYLTVSSEKFDEFLVAGGAQEDVASKVGAEKPTLEFTITDTQLTVKIGESFDQTFIFGKGTEVKFAGIKFVETMVKTEKGYSSTLKFEDKTGYATLNKTDEGFEETLVLDGITAKRRYKKV